MANIKGIVSSINGPVVKGFNMGSFKVHEMVTVGQQKLIGEVVSLEGEVATVQVYEETEGLKAGEVIYSTGSPLSLTLGPGMIGNIFDGIQRPLQKIQEMNKDFIPEGIGLLSLDMEKKWDVTITARVGDKLEAGDVYATVQETNRILHKLLVPFNVKGTVVKASRNSEYTLNDTVVVIEKENKETVNLTLCTKWPVRMPRPINERLPLYKPLAMG